MRWLGACLESFCWRASSHLICYAHAHLMQQAAPDFLMPLAQHAPCACKFKHSLYFGWAWALKWWKKTQKIYWKQTECWDLKKLFYYFAIHCEDNIKLLNWIILFFLLTNYSLFGVFLRNICAIWKFRLWNIWLPLYVSCNIQKISPTSQNIINFFSQHNYK